MLCFTYDGLGSRSYSRWKNSINVERTDEDKFYIKIRRVDGGFDMYRVYPENCIIIGKVTLQLHQLNIHGGQNCCLVLVKDMPVVIENNTSQGTRQISSGRNLDVLYLLYPGDRLISMWPDEDGDHVVLSLAEDNSLQETFHKPLIQPNTMFDLFDELVHSG